eukprot:gene41904-51154_t
MLELIKDGLDILKAIYELRDQLKANDKACMGSSSFEQQESHSRLLAGGTSTTAANGAALQLAVAQLRDVLQDVREFIAKYQGGGSWLKKAKGAAMNVVRRNSRKDIGRLEGHSGLSCVAQADEEADQYWREGLLKAASSSDDDESVEASTTLFVTDLGVAGFRRPARWALPHLTESSSYILNRVSSKLNELLWVLTPAQGQRTFFPPTPALNELLWVLTPAQ